MPLVRNREVLHFEVRNVGWIVNWHSCWQLVEQLMSLSLHKLSYYQRGLKAMSLIQSAHNLAF